MPKVACCVCCYVTKQKSRPRQFFHGTPSTWKQLKNSHDHDNCWLTVNKVIRILNQLVLRRFGILKHVFSLSAKWLEVCIKSRNLGWSLRCAYEEAIRFESQKKCNVRDLTENSNTNGVKITPCRVIKMCIYPNTNTRKNDCTVPEVATTRTDKNPHYF